MKTKVTIKKTKKRRYTEEEIYAMPTIEGWKVTFDQLPVYIEEFKKPVLTNLASNPYLIADDKSEAIMLINMMKRTFKKRYDKCIGDNNFNGFLVYLCNDTLDRIKGGQIDEC